ncbi:MAG: YeeE/YedE family protein [Saprospiraceae bacterium]|nr:YeeE/YedE family protein [Saprospiraceae bacterium]
MRLLRFLLIGILFGIVLTKSEVISWYRIQEMFRFQSFHMYGVIGVAVIAGAIIQYLFKEGYIKGFEGKVILPKDKPKTYTASIVGGTFFGLGWALTGACPGPLYILLGHGYGSILIVIGSALLGTLFYGLLRARLPH